jgi:hypothetical protein
MAVGRGATKPGASSTSTAPRCCVRPPHSSATTTPLAAGLLALADGRKEKATGDAATATPDFFQKGRTYTRNLPYRAPELRPDFQCIGIGQHPTKDEPRAFGFYRDGSTSPWGSAALSTDRWADGWVEIVETEETR